MSNGYVWEWVQPGWLWLLAAALPVLLWSHFHSLSDAPRGLRWASLAIRWLVITCVVVSMAGLVLLTATPRQMIVLAVDQSESIDEAAREVTEAFIRQARAEAEQRGDVTLRFVPYGAEPQAVRREWPNAAKTSASKAAEKDARSPLLGTDIAAAIQTAAAAIPPSYVPRLVLLSDGNATQGDAIAAAAAAGMPIDTVPLPVRTTPEVQLAAVQAPAEVRQGEPFFVEVVVNANQSSRGFIDLYRGDVRVSDQDAVAVDIEQGENRFRFRQTVTDEKQIAFVARLRDLETGDTLLDNNEASALVYAQGKPRVLLIDSNVDQTDGLRWALDSQDITVDVRPPEGLPQTLAELQAYECLMLSNVPATAMTLQQMDHIRSYVQDLGGGLVMLGGDQSFGLGGYYNTQLEEILPVRSNFEKEREKPGLAMVLVIDRSGSMGGEKIALAKDAATAAVELIGPRDSIGVIAFDNESYWVSELTPGGERGAIMDQIAKIDAGGGTNMYPAMSEAFQALAATQAKLKHCILLTDGISESGDFVGLAAEMAAQQMTVTTVSMGDGADQQLLAEVARMGNGRHYVCDDPQAVPQVFAKETIEASQSAMNELPFFPQVVRPTPVLADIDLELAPLLLGYVVTRAKPTSERILSSENGEPLLVWWRYGLGMTVAFTSDAHSRWAAEWLAWPDFGPFWAQVIRHAMRKGNHQQLSVDWQRDGEQSKVVVDAVDRAGAFLIAEQTQLTIVDPHLQTQTLALEETAPGRYEATFATNQRGTYQVDLAVQAANAEPLRQSRGFVVGYSDELRLLPVNESTLRALASVSGGMFDPSPKAAVRPSIETARRPIPLWPWFLMTAIVLLVADVGVRRFFAANTGFKRPS